MEDIQMKNQLYTEKSQIQGAGWNWSGDEKA